ncbi:MAG: hypothetical protein IJ099_04775 [Alphaproteobacteria bacterium]|nr:hypothetical protein [Alphaproteobacteria bacterium]
MKFVALLFMYALLWIAPAIAKTEFSAEINVDVAAASAVEAKEKAMLQAQREAFLQVAGKLTDAENVEKLQELTDDEIVHFIQSVGVGEEKTGGNKYVATLTIQIDESLLRDYLAENDMIETETAELLVIPVFKSGENTMPMLWENDNLWRQNWTSKGIIKFGTMQMRTISAYSGNAENIDATTALYMDSSRYETLSTRNNTDRIYVAYAQTMQNGDLKVTLINVKNKLEDSFTVYNDGSENVFDKAIEKSVMYISNMERNSRYSERPHSSGMINVVYIYENMKDWLNKNTALSSLPMVEAIDTKSFGGGKVNFSLRYTGTLDDLWLAMQEIGLSHEAADNYFIIR